MFLCLHVFYQSQDSIICMPASEIKYVKRWRQSAFFFSSSKLKWCMFFSQIYVKARELHVWHKWGVVRMRGLCWGNGSHILRDGRGLGATLSFSLPMGFSQLGTCFGLGVLSSSFPFSPFSVFILGR